MYGLPAEVPTLTSNGYKAGTLLGHVYTISSVLVPTAAPLQLSSEWWW